MDQVDVPKEKRPALGAATRIVNLLYSPELDLADEERHTALAIARALVSLPDDLRADPLTDDQR